MTEEDEKRERAAVAAAVMSWCRTPFHHNARVKGAGVDCVNLTYGALHEAGAIEEVSIPAYAPDWMLHSDDDRLIDGLKRYADEVAGPPERKPLPGDIVVWRVGRAFAHVALVTDWPTIVHAYNREPVCPTDAESDRRLGYTAEQPGEETRRRPRRFFVLRRWSRG